MPYPARTAKRPDASGDHAMRIRGPKLFGSMLFTIVTKRKCPIGGPLSVPPAVVNDDSY